MFFFVLCVLTLLSTVAVFGCSIRLLYLLYDYTYISPDVPKVDFWLKAVKLAGLIFLFFGVMMSLSNIAVQL